MSKNQKILTFGCRLNIYESEKINELLQAYKIDDLIIVNTCAVTAEAERQARQSIRKLKSENPDKRIIVTGCSATIHQEIYQNMPEVSRVITNSQKNDEWRFLQMSQKNSSFFPIFQERSSQLLTGFEGKSRAFLQIQTGCDNACTFCVIRIARGPSQSFPVSKILEQAQRFVEQGYHEINLTGVDIASYHNDNLNLGKLLKKLLKILPQHVRIRLSSLDPARIDDDLYQIMEDHRLLPHWHLSLQSGDPVILKHMARRHSPEDIVRLSNKIRSIRPNVALGADLIVGFPGETLSMFENTCTLVQECQISLLHIFPYSDRPGTVAMNLKPKILKRDKKERAQKLRQIGQDVLKQTLYQYINKTMEAFIEYEKDGVFYGKTENFFPIRIKTSSKIGEFMSVRITNVEQENNNFVLCGISSPL